MDDGYSDGSRSSSQYGPGFYAPDDPRATRDKVSSSSLTQAPPMKMGSFVKVEVAPKDAHIGKGSRCFRTMMYLNRAWIPNIVAGVIVFDLIVTCIDIDERAAGRAVPPALNTVMIVCIVVYTMEFALNTWLLKLKFLRELTTWLDAFVLICGWVELIIYQMGREDLYFFRDIRMLRVVRICRLANLIRKTRSLRELRKMITMFSTCARTLAWSLLFCFGMMTMWAMLLVELVNPLCCLTDAACTQCSKATGSIMEANLLLFKTVIAGDSWGTIAVPIIEAAPLTAIIFCGSLLTLVFGVLNLVVVVVVDTFAETREAFRLALLQPPLSAAEEMDRFWAPIQLGKCFTVSEQMLTYLKTVEKQDILAAWKHAVEPKVRAKIVIKLFGDGRDPGELSTDQAAKQLQKVGGNSAASRRVERERHLATVLHGLANSSLRQQLLAAPGAGYFPQTLRCDIAAGPEDAEDTEEDSAEESPPESTSLMRRAAEAPAAPRPETS